MTVAVLATIAAPACGGPGSGGAGPATVTDSAGVRVVVSTRSAWRGGEAWTVGPEPVLSVGEGDPSFERIAGVVRLDDGRLVVLDGGSGRVRWLSADGAIAVEAGGLGEGPDEFRSPADLALLPGDTVLVWDAGSRSLVAYLDGRRVDRFGLPAYADGSLRAPLPLNDGRFIVPARAAIGNRPMDADGRTRFEAPVLRWGRGEDTFDTLTFAATDEIMTMRIGGRSAMGRPPYAKLTTFAVEGDRVFVGDGEARIDDRGRGWMQVDVFAATGEPVEVVRAPAPRGAVEPADRESYLNILERRARSPQEVAMLPALRTSLVFPERHPAYGELRVDDDGRMWLRTGLVVTPPAPPAGPWTVLSADGTLLGSVSMPDRFELRLIAGDDLIGVWRDPADIEHLRVYRLIR